MSLSIDKKYDGRWADAGRSAEKAVLAKFKNAKIMTCDYGYKIVEGGKMLGYGYHKSHAWIAAEKTINGKGLIL